MSGQVQACELHTTCTMNKTNEKVTWLFTPPLEHGEHGQTDSNVFQNRQARYRQQLTSTGNGDRIITLIKDWQLTSAACDRLNP
jgi:hypothetical protein